MPNPLNSPHEIAKRIKDNLLLGVMEELSGAKGSDRTLIFVTHGLFEVMISTLISKRTKLKKKITSDTRTFSYSVQILILYEVGVISEAQYMRLEWFRKLRNRAAHNPIFKVTQEDIKNSNLHVHDFQELCTNFVLSFVNTYMQDLADVLVPTLVKLPLKGK